MSLFVKGQTKMQTAWGLIFCLVLFVIGLLLILMTRENLKRVKAERQSSLLRGKNGVISTDSSRPQSLVIN